MSIIPIYSRQNLRDIDEKKHVVWFFSGPTCWTDNKCNYEWRREFVDLIRTDPNFKPTKDIYIIIPEGEKSHWTDIENDTWNEWTNYAELQFMQNLPPTVGYKQLAWEHIAYHHKANLFLCNIALHWKTDYVNGLHGNIGPTTRFEVGDIISSKYQADVLLYSPLNTFSSSQNSFNETNPGSEQPGESIAWAHFHAQRKGHIIARNLDSMIKQFIHLTKLKEDLLASRNRQYNLYV